MNNKVFISYAKEDLQTAEKLYDYLRQFDYDPWIDGKHLLPGQDWNIEIKLALKRADFVVLLLSQTSVAKRGYVQREFKQALDYCEEKLDTDIYIIPCKIDDCEVPERLTKYQWAELQTPDSFDLILQSLNHQRNKYQNEEKIRILANTSFETSEVLIKKVFQGRPKQTVGIVYPRFVDSGNESLKSLNTFIEYPILKSYFGFLEPFGDSLFAGNGENHEFESEDHNLDISYKFKLITKDVISLNIFTFSYKGGAHGLYGTKGHNYRLNPPIEFNLCELLDNDSKTLASLRSLCKAKLLKRAKEEFNIEREQDFFLNESHLVPEWRTFDNFYLTSESLVIIFPIYQETAFALGEHEIEIPFDELLSKHRLKSLQRLKYLLRK